MNKKRNHFYIKWEESNFKNLKHKFVTGIILLSWDELLRVNKHLFQNTALLLVHAQINLNHTNHILLKPLTLIFCRHTKEWNGLLLLNFVFWWTLEQTVLKAVLGTDLMQLVIHKFQFLWQRELLVHQRSIFHFHRVIRYWRRLLKASSWPETILF